MHFHVSEDGLLRKFWEIEESLINKKHCLTEEEKKCEEIFTNSTKRDSCGRYMVTIFVVLNLYYLSWATERAALAPCIFVCCTSFSVF
jgi:hypothetical protein